MSVHHVAGKAVDADRLSYTGDVRRDAFPDVERVSSTTTDTLSVGPGDTVFLVWRVDEDTEVVFQTFEIPSDSETRAGPDNETRAGDDQSPQRDAFVDRRRPASHRGDVFAGQ